jgi:N-acetylmuramoyl-L-alanine amidase
MKRVFLAVVVVLFSLALFGDQDGITKEDQSSLNSLLTDLMSKKATKKLENIKVWPADSSIRVVIYPSEKVKYKYNLLPGKKKDRIYIDLLSVDAKDFKMPEIEYDNFLKNIRIGKKKTSVRIVLDTDKVESYNVIEMEEPWRIVIDYYGKKKKEEIKVATVKKASEKKRIIKKKKVEKPSQRKAIVVIDPGHGGKDPGAVTKDLYEKTIVFKLAKKIKKMSKDYDSLEVKLTRDKDIFLPLEERAAIANKMEGDLFISLHANSFADKNVGGMEIYHLDNTRNEYTTKLAMVENKISNKKSLLNTILVDMTMSYYVKDSLKYARSLGLTLKKNLKPYKIRLRGYKKGALFYVLVGARMPSMLFEVGFLTNKKERKLLQEDEYLEMIAESVLSSIDAVLQKEVAKK